MDIWSRIFAEKFRIILKVCVRTDKGKKGYQPNVDRSGQGRGRSKITENMRTFFMNGAKSQGSKNISYKKVCDIIFQTMDYICVCVKAKLSMSHNCIEITY